MKERTESERLALLNVERLDYIIKELQQEKVVYVDNLSKKYFVSGSTIRRDLSQLEKEGFLRRTHGGAVIADFDNTPLPFAVRKEENHIEKDIIASLAARLVRDEMYIELDSSTTVMHMVKYLKSKNNLRIVTNSAQLALRCLELQCGQVFCMGGWLNSYSCGCVGEIARQCVLNFNPDLMFFSAKSISIEDGITDYSDEESILRQTMIQKAKKAVFLCDSGKFDQLSYRSICGVDQIDCIITDRKPTDRWLKFLEEVKVEILYPGSK